MPFKWILFLFFLSIAELSSEDALGVVPEIERAGNSGASVNIEGSLRISPSYFYIPPDFEEGKLPLQILRTQETPERFVVYEYDPRLQKELAYGRNGTGMRTREFHGERILEQPEKALIQSITVHDKESLNRMLQTRSVDVEDFHGRNSRYSRRLKSLGSREDGRFDWSFARSLMEGSIAGAYRQRVNRATGSTQGDQVWGAPRRAVTGAGFKGNDCAMALIDAG